MTTTRFCPDCGGAIEVPDDQELPPGAVVRHERGKCPGMDREPEYEYRLHFVATRCRVGEDDDEHRDGFEYTVAEGVEVLANISEAMVAESFPPIAFDLSQRVGEKWQKVLEHASLIDAN